MRDADLEKPLDDEGSYQPNHYEVLGLDETASTRAIAKAFLAGDDRWAWYERVAETVARRREEAYRVLGDPVRRAAYDMQQGHTKDYLARRIAQSSKEWSVAWAVLFGFLALLFFVDHENMSRMIGSNFAPDFAERRAYVEQEICEDRDGWIIECAPGYFEGEFHSSDERWQWVLNSWVTLSLGPAVLAGVVAFGGYHLFKHMAGKIIAWVRYEGHADTWVRVGLWFLVLLIPLTIFIQLARYGLGVSTPYT